MSETDKLYSDYEKTCCLCATPQNEGQSLFLEGSEELTKLVAFICDLLKVDSKDIDLHPKSLCNSCHTGARNVQQFLELVKRGQNKLHKLFRDSYDVASTKEVRQYDENVSDNIESLENLEEMCTKVTKSRTKSRKRVLQTHKVECFDVQNKEIREKRLRRKPQRLVEEIELKQTKKAIIKATTSFVKVENEIDSCALITSQPIAELRTAAGNTLGEIVQVEPNTVKENLNVSAKTYFICEYCKDVFPRQNAFLKHIATHRNCIYECKECLETFSDRNGFTRHQTSTSHKGCGIIEDMAGEKKFLLKDKAPSAASINIFVAANGQITSIDEMDDKIEKAYDSLKHSSEDASEVVAISNDIKTSIKDSNKKLTSNSKKYACLACSKSFDYPYAVRRHYKLVHIAERKHKCSLCPAAFKTKFNYNLHFASHTGEKNFSCNFCPKTFKTKHQRKIHNRVHTGEKPFKCLVCLKTFANRCNLNTHKRVHTGERPYRCSTCESNFTTSSSLKEHKRVHLKTAQRKLKSMQDGETKQKSKRKVNAFHMNSNLDVSQCLVKNEAKPISLLKPLNNNIKPVENQMLSTELPELPSITNVQIFPAITNSSDSSALCVDIKKSSASIHPQSELPLIQNIQILPAIAGYNKSHSFKSIAAPNQTIATSTNSFNELYKFQCSTCLQKFKQSSALRKHQRTHTGERPYKCPMCPKSFADPSNFKKHRMLHKNATDALKSIYVSKSSTMQELRQMLAEQSITISSHAPTDSTSYAASDPDPDGLETFSRSLPCPSEFADTDAAQNEQNSNFSAALGNYMSWNKLENTLPFNTEEAIINNSLMAFKDIPDAGSSASTAAINANQLVCISYQDPNNPIRKTTTYYVVN